MQADHPCRQHMLTELQTAGADLCFRNLPRGVDRKERHRAAHLPDALGHPRQQAARLKALPAVLGRRGQILRTAHPQLHSRICRCIDQPLPRAFLLQYFCALTRLHDRGVHALWLPLHHLDVRDALVGWNTGLPCAERRPQECNGLSASMFLHAIYPVSAAGRSGACLELIQHSSGIHHHDQRICRAQLRPNNILCDVLQQACTCWARPCMQQGGLVVCSAA